MKKLLAFSMGAVLMLGLVACGNPPASDSSAPSLSVSPSESSQPAGSEVAAPPMPMVADAAMYRGTVSDLVSGTPASGDTVHTFTFTLQQAEGTNFGAPSLKFAFTADTKADFTPEAGQYLEVYYGAAMGAPLDTQAVHNVITAVKYHSAEMVNYNGYVKAIVPHPEKPGQGKLIMVPTPEEVTGSVTADNTSGAPKGPDGALITRETPGPNEIHYNYDKEKTQFYLNFDQIKAGDRLNIFQSGAMAMSMPPQCFALEVRKYAEPAAQ